MEAAAGGSVGVAVEAAAGVAVEAAAGAAAGAAAAAGEASVEAAVPAIGAAAAGSRGCSSLFPEPKCGSSSKGPLVALIPSAGLLAGIVGMSPEATGVDSAAVGAGVSVALVGRSTEGSLTCV